MKQRFTWLPGMAHCRPSDAYTMPEEAPMRPIILHVNGVEQGQTIDEMCERAVRWGYDGIEFRRRRGDVAETPAQYLDAIARARDRTGLKHVCFGAPGPNLMQPDAAARQRETESYAEFLRAASRRLGVNVVNTFAGPLLNQASAAPFDESVMHGSFIATDDHYAWAVEGFRQLAPLAGELGLCLAFETQRRHLHDTPASALKLVTMIGHPAVGITLDYACILGQPDPPAPEDIVDRLAGRLAYVHLRNIVRLGHADRLRVGLGDGEINHRALLRAMFRHGYAGPLCVEFPRPGDREWFARQDIAYLRAVLADLGA